MRTSVNANVAAVVQTATSQAAIRPSPPARAGPPTRATTGLRALPDRGEHLAEPAIGGCARADRRRGLLEVGAGAEHRAGVGEHDHPDRVVGVRRGQRGEQLVDQRRWTARCGWRGLSRVSVATPPAPVYWTSHAGVEHAGTLWNARSTSRRRAGPARRRAARRRRRTRPGEPVRGLRPRAVLRDAVRLLRLQHLHRRARACSAPATPSRSWTSSPWPRKVIAPAPGRHRLLRRRHADAAAAGRPRPHPGRHRPDLGPGRRRRGDDRGQPRVGRRRPSLRALRAAGFTRISLGMQSAAPARAGACSTAGTPRAGRAPRPRGGPRRRVRARQPRPDLRHAGGDGPRTSPPRCDAVIAAGVDHVSAYALIVEDGTRLAARMRPRRAAVPGRRRGRRPLPGRRRRP